MDFSDKPPEQLSERELFSEYVELLQHREGTEDPYREVEFQKRQAQVLAEIGERLEALEAVKALICDSSSTPHRKDGGTSQQNLTTSSDSISFDDV